jgi:hypothetical protein
MRISALLLFLALALPGCGGDDPKPEEGGGTTPVGDNAAFEDSWMFAVAQDPARMEPFERGASGQAWLGFFHNDLRAAAREFDGACTPSAEDLPARAAKGYACVGRARTHLELARFYETAAQIDRVAQRQFFKHRTDNPQDVLDSVHQPFFEGLILLHSGDRAGGVAALEGYRDGGHGEPVLVALAARIIAGLGNDPLVDRVWGGAGDAASGAFDDLPTSPATKAYANRLRFIAAVAGDDFKAAGQMFRELAPNEADYLEELTGSQSLLAPTIHHHDAAFLISMARYHALNVLDATGGAPQLGALSSAANRVLGRQPGDPGVAPSLADGMALVLFSPVPTPADLWSEEASWPDRTATLARLQTTVPEFANAPTLDLGDLDPFVKGSNVVKLGLGELLGDAGPAGANMNSDMGLAERFRARIIMERAWQYQRAFDVRLEGDDGADLASAGVAARSLFELVLDKTPTPPNSRLKAARVSFRNDPPFLIDLARAHLDTRHSYDANEYVRPLTEIYPELIATREALASLDSAWNPARKGSVR